MIVIIPLGGTGERFKKNNYKSPKSLIKIFGQPLIFYLLDCINTYNIDYVYIPYNKEYSNYRFEDLLIKKYPNIKFKFFKLINNTRGAAETLNISIKELDIKEDKPVLCLDGDNFYNIDIIKLWNGSNGIVTFEDHNIDPIYSYIELNNGKIINIKEKEKISINACSGAYGFSSIKNLLKYTQFVIDNNLREKDEFYTSVVIKEMINNGIEFKNISIEKKNWICIGTPIQLRHFYHNYPKISCNNNSTKIKNKRYCFDFDNTLVTYPEVKDDYTTVKPIEKNIKFLKYLKQFGNTIIIYTARRMKTHNGNVGKINADIGRITFDTLEKFNIPYDEIYFGKPYADIYIDDLALNCFDDLEKELGFYLDGIDTRSFNELELNTIETFTKKSNDLSGEIYYYKNIPFGIKDLFGSMIDYDENNEWYKMEKINGLTATTLYLSELLTKDNLKHIMNSIKRIQEITVMDTDNINIYSNYLHKVKKRFAGYDYSKFENYNEVYNSIIDELFTYENESKGRKTVIHGDPVMTNILINNYDKIKFIDMRGKIDGKLSIYGDWLYDWAKLYQSLIGYDKVLQEKSVSLVYENEMKNYFKEYFIKLYSQNDFNNLKIVTKSLLFSLIPLHNNDKCYYYFKLIEIV